MTNLEAVIHVLDRIAQQADTAQRLVDKALTDRAYYIGRAAELGATQSDIATAAGLTRQRVAQIIRKERT